MEKHNDNKNNNNNDNNNDNNKNICNINLKKKTIILKYQL